MFGGLISRLSRLQSRKGLYPFLEQQLRQVPANSRVLSVGSGGGIARTVHRVASEAGFSVWELDVDPDRNPDIVGDIHTYQAPEKFDFIILCEVLEHLYNPWTAVANLPRQLHPGGKVIVSAPFIFPIHDEPVDYYRFTQFGLRRLFHEYFEIESLEPANKPLEAVAVLLYRFHTERNFAARLFGIIAVLFSPLLYAIINFLLFFVRGSRITTRYHLVARVADPPRRAETEGT